MASVLVPLAQGCEELEAVTVVDLLRRAGIEVITAGLDAQPVRASRGMMLIPDMSLDAALQLQGEAGLSRITGSRQGHAQVVHLTKIGPGPWLAEG